MKQAILSLGTGRSQTINQKYGHDISGSAWVVMVTEHFEPTTTGRFDFALPLTLELLPHKHTW